MSDIFKIDGNQRLEGEVSAGGSKNSGLPILASVVLFDSPITINNLPDIEDTNMLISILKMLGANIDRLNKNSIIIDPTTINSTVVDKNLGSKIRGSYYLLGSLLSKFKKSSIPEPGGCNIGKRPMDLHFKVLEEFGATISQSDGFNNVVLKKTIKNKVEIVLPFPSRGATINTIFAASLLDNVETTIKNANNSPETNGIVELLRLAGLNIKRINDMLYIKGVKKLNLNNYSIPADKIEVGTLLVAGLITKGEVKVNNIKSGDLGDLKYIFDSMNAKYILNENFIVVKANQFDKLKSTFLISGLYKPCIDADYEPIFTPLLCKIDGFSLIDDAINPERHSKFINRLNSIGANIIETSPTRAIINGNKNMKFLPNTNLEALDIRGGVAQLIASLSSEGESRLSNIIQIDRGYELIDDKINLLGGKIKRIKNV